MSLKNTQHHFLRTTLRKDDKSQLAHAMDEYFNNGVSIETTPDAVPCMERHVIDGGYLIRKPKLKKGDTYCKIAKVYADFTIKHYGLATVVFVGYDAGPPIKNDTHKKNQQTCMNVVFISLVMLNSKANGNNSFQWEVANNY